MLRRDNHRGWVATVHRRLRRPRKHLLSVLGQWESYDQLQLEWSGEVGSGGEVGGAEGDKVDLDVDEQLVSSLVSWLLTKF